MGYWFLQIQKALKPENESSGIHLTKCPACLLAEMQKRTETCWDSSHLDTCKEQVQAIQEILSGKIEAGGLEEVLFA